MDLKNEFVTAAKDSHRKQQNISRLETKICQLRGLRCDLIAKVRKQQNSRTEKPFLQLNCFYNLLTIKSGQMKEQLNKYTKECETSSKKRKRNEEEDSDINENKSKIYRLEAKINNLRALRCGLMEKERQQKKSPIEKSLLQLKCFFNLYKIKSDKMKKKLNKYKGETGMASKKRKTYDEEYIKKLNFHQLETKINQLRGLRCGLIEKVDKLRKSPIEKSLLQYKCFFNLLKIKSDQMKEELNKHKEECGTTTSNKRKRHEEKNDIETDGHAVKRCKK